MMLAPSFEIAWKFILRSRFLPNEFLTTAISNGAATPIDREFCAVNKTGTIRGQKYDSFRDLIWCSRAAGRRLGGQFLQPFTHCFSSFRARRSGSYCINPDAARAIFGRPHLSYQINGGLGRASTSRRPTSSSRNLHLASCRADFCDRLFATFNITIHDDDVDSKGG